MTRPILIPLPVRHAVAAPGSEPANPHFAALGGEPVVRRLVERFYHHMETRADAAVIRALHPADLGPVREVLVRYLTEWTGGPPVYSSERGHPRLRQRHMGFAIGESERDAWMACMQCALSEVVADEPLRADLEERFQALADMLRNRPT